MDFAKLSDNAPCPEKLLARLGIIYICMYYNIYVCIYILCVCVCVCVCVDIHYDTIDITELDFFSPLFLAELGEKTKPLSDVC